MTALVDRDYCLKHPLEISRLFGVGVWFSMLLKRRTSLLEQVVDSYAARAFPMPGYLGRAYRIAALIELRVARIYARMADKFKDHAAAREFFEELRQEEEHSRLMTLCLYTVKFRSSVIFIPQMRDPTIRGLLKSLRDIHRRVDAVTLDEALRITEELEQGEVNVIFDKMLKQNPDDESHFFETQMQAVEGHSESVPRRIRMLRHSGGMQ